MPTTLDTVPSRPPRPDGPAGPGPYPHLTGHALAAVTVAASAATFFVPGVLSGPDVMQGSARGTALVMLLVAVPALLLAMWRARRGSIRAVLVWLGTCGYLTYNAVMLLFGTPFNRLFLLYVAVLGLSLASLIALLSSTDPDDVARRLASAPARLAAGYIAVIAVGNALVWLRVVVPALGSVDPAFLRGTGLTTNPIYVQDLAFWLPLAGAIAWWLWRREGKGYLLGGGLLVMWLIEAVGVAGDQWLGSRADPGSSVATMGGAYLFIGLGVVGATVLAVFLRRTADDLR